MRRIISYQIIDSSGQVVRKGNNPFNHLVSIDQVTQLRRKALQKHGWECFFHSVSVTYDSVLKELNDLKLSNDSLFTDYDKRLIHAVIGMSLKFNLDKLVDQCVTIKEVVVEQYARRYDVRYCDLMNKITNTPL